MSLPTYRRTSSSFVTLYRLSEDGSLTELGCWFGPSAHAQADAQQQRDVLEHAEPTDHKQNNSSDQV
jgi:hypothetical protein